MSASTAHTDSSLAHYQQAVENAETALGADLTNRDKLQQLQQHYRALEQRLAAQAGTDSRHHFIITIPVADRPQQLQRCLDSLYQLCEQFHYGRNSAGKYRKLTLLISDDSSTSENRKAIQSLTESFGSTHQIESIYFGHEEQQALLQQMGIEELSTLEQSIALPESNHEHKGASTTRNLAYLKLHQLQQQWSDREKLLFWFVDSDQEFQINISDGSREQERYCINYLYLFDQIFQQHDPIMLTGKLVGDPPVSPTVMASNLLLDLNHFLATLQSLDATAPCQFHQHQSQSEGEAAYHDMTDLFGYPVPATPYQYRCELQGAHDHNACLQRFSERLNRFFHGEHPTRRSYHLYQTVTESIKPARTVYTANYLFTPEGLNAFIPFAKLKLRMAGPMLGRFLQRQWGKRFLSANLPMVHKRTLDREDRAEHRPGVEQQTQQQVDFSAEFERQFYGDVALFTIEPLTQSGKELAAHSKQEIHTLLQQTEAKMRQRYQQQREEIATRLQQFETQWRSGWWYQHSPAVEQAVAHFIDNIRNNFLEPSKAWQLINSEQHRQQRLEQIATALQQYPQAQQAWAELLQQP